MMGGRHIHLDAVGGIAGDMFAAALVAALPELGDRVLADAAAVLPAGAGRPVLTTVYNGGIRALHLALVPEGGAHGRHGDDHHGHDHHDHSHHDHGQHDHGHHHHDHSDHHRHAHPASGTGAGTFLDMCARIESSAIAPRAAGHAIGILTILAEAEAHIHGVPLDSVHFHEIADWDSLMDVVAAGSLIAALEELSPALSWSVSDLPRGGGLIRTHHGLLPCPAPATAHILRGFAWRDDGIAGERVTPTGAAILRHLAAGPRPAAGRLIGEGAGAGTRSLPGMPNITRALVFADAQADDAASDGDQVAVLCFEVDDMTGEEIAEAAKRLRDAPGVLDLSMDTRIGKKGRPLQGFRLLVRPAELDRVAGLCLLESSTIGLRWHLAQRRILPRSQRSAGGMRLKEVMRPGGLVTRKVESDDLAGRSLAERRRLQRAAEEDGDER